MYQFYTVTVFTLNSTSQYTTHKTFQLNPPSVPLYQSIKKRRTFFMPVDTYPFYT